MRILRDFSELDCLRRLRHDDEQAFDALFNHYSDPVYRFAYNYLKSYAAAEEIVQDCFLKIWEKRRELQTDVPLKGYLFTIAHHGVLKQLRREQLQWRLQTDLASVGSPQVANEAGFAELESLYRAALEKLPPRRREIFELSRQQGLSYPEIARQLNLSVKTVEAQMTHALKFMRSYFLAHGENMLGVILLLAVASN